MFALLYDHTFLFSVSIFVLKYSKDLYYLVCFQTFGNSLNTITTIRLHPLQKIIDEQINSNHQKQNSFKIKKSNIFMVNARFPSDFVWIYTGVNQ